jgi:DNA-binding transcriptional regulator PaaX
MSGFDDLKTRIKARGRPKSLDGFINLLKAFSYSEEQVFIASQRMIAEGRLSDNLEAAIDQAM